MFEKAIFESRLFKDITFQWVRERSKYTDWETNYNWCERNNTHNFLFWVTYDERIFSRFLENIVYALVWQARLFAESTLLCSTKANRNLQTILLFNLFCTSESVHLFVCICVFVNLLYLSLEWSCFISLNQAQTVIAKCMAFPFSLDLTLSGIECSWAFVIAQKEK